MRPHHWMKNLLVFLPIFTSHRWDETATLIAALIAFVAMCLAASAVYVGNDLLDVYSDRHHPRKKNRPVAGGAVRAPTAMRFALVLVVASLVLAWMVLPWQVGVMVSGYLLLSGWYAVRLKQIAVADVTAIGGLHVWRVWVGGAATGIGVSGWLLGFAVCLFMSIACVKRYAELRHGQTLHDGRLIGRGYERTHGRGIGWLGVVAGGFAVAILTKYANGASAATLYSQPLWLWVGCGLLGFWLARLWWLARRGKLIDDPLLFAIRDVISWVVLAGFVVVVWLAMTG